jgi:hypothetical protein
MQHQNKALPLFNEVQVGDLRPTLKPQNRPIGQLCKMELAKKKFCKMDRENTRLWMSAIGVVGLAICCVVGHTK